MKVSRRSFLVGATSGIASFSLPAQAQELLALALGPQQIETPVSAFDRLITPVGDFFVRSHFGPPRLNPGRRISVVGSVKRSLDLAPSDLGRYKRHSVTAVLQCAGSGRRFSEPRVPGVQWGHGAMGQAEWTGVRLADVLEDAGVEAGASHVGLAGADLPPTPQVPAFHRSLPMTKAVDPETLIAVEMNGRPLDLNHGAPARLVVPGWAADHWMKWLTQVVARPDEDPGYFMQKAYRMPKEPVAAGSAVPLEDTKPLHEIPVKSVIARPTEGEVLPAGPQEIVGVAFSGYGALQSVEVSVDGGSTWTTAQLEGESGIGRWQVFRSTQQSEGPGPITVCVRARDSAGNIQPEQPQWNPSGYLWNGWHKVTWSVG